MNDTIYVIICRVWRDEPSRTSDGYSESVTIAGFVEDHDRAKEIVEGLASKFDMGFRWNVFGAEEHYYAWRTEETCESGIRYTIKKVKRL